MKAPLSLIRLVERSGFARAWRRAEGADPEPEPQPGLRREPEPEPSPAVMALGVHHETPRRWNLWELERLAEAMNGDARAEERTLLLLHMRDFADPAGNLPPEFDALVREAFGADLVELVT